MSTPNRPITDFLARGEPVVSVEFFPPKDEAGGEQIVRTAQRLREELGPHFVSITYGAGGGTRERTFRYASILKDDYGFEVMPHLTCVGSPRSEILEIVREYQEKGFCNLMVLRGDPPKGETAFIAPKDGCAYGNELVQLIRENFSGFCLGVGGYPEKHPEASDLATDILHLKRKVEAGASFVTTQLFFDNARYFEFVEACRGEGIDVPILPGLLPVLSLKQIDRFCKMCGARLPEALRVRLEAANGEAEGERLVGVQWALEQVRELLARGAPGIHLYILNRSKSALDLAKALRAEGLAVGQAG